MRDRFYLRSSHGDLGSNIVWHRHNGAGYHSDIAQAHVYTLEEAQKEWTESWGDSQPISADHVDALATWKVDHQLIPSKTVLHDNVNEYVAYQSGRWDGNDVYWLNKLAFSTFTDFSKASVFTRREIDIFLKHQTDYVVIPFADAEKVKRRTFEASLFNARVMVQGAGLKATDQIKKNRRRADKEYKTRFNCPECGKISWQHNPHYFEGCLDVNCIEWSAFK